ncbi:Nodule Cysteine-Rich (NCR) secreted peptide [Medicago truncatula]|uniref:Nodule Cysteine-Rich (NCR) secreted peptide n=1 Tax=Medicago truncatula TaxID=3880 RepID=A0A072VAL4_MEDTR|nr:Nodule Cysteine-Rich (NCR) secreted peptide [Medicago truncatula]
MAEFINFVSVIILLISLFFVIVNGEFENYCTKDSDCESYCPNPKYGKCLDNKCICQLIWMGYG